MDYIWIDSLCIRQGDPIDWKVESEKMAGVYSGSYCNIAAAAASNPHMRLFCQGDRWLAEPCIVRVGNSDRPIIRNKFWEEEMDSQPLMQRGWVVQERLLAPRTLHFSRHQVFWECSQTLACEAFPQGLRSMELKAHQQKSRTYFSQNIPIGHKLRSVTLGAPFLLKWISYQLFME